jgi:hypothetical protein
MSGATPSGERNDVGTGLGFVPAILPSASRHSGKRLEVNVRRVFTIDAGKRADDVKTAVAKLELRRLFNDSRLDKHSETGPFSERLGRLARIGFDRPQGASKLICVNPPSAVHRINFPETSAACTSGPNHIPFRGGSTFPSIADGAGSRKRPRVTIEQLREHAASNRGDQVFHEHGGIQ